MSGLDEYREGVEELIEGTRDAAARSTLDQEALQQRVNHIAEIQERADRLQTALAEASKQAMEIVELVVAEGNTADETVGNTAVHAKDAEELLFFAQEKIGDSSNYHTSAAITNLGYADDEATQTASLTSQAHSKVEGVGSAMDGVEQFVANALGAMATFHERSYELTRMFVLAAEGARRTAESNMAALKELEEYSSEAFQ